MGKKAGQHWGWGTDLRRTGEAGKPAGRRLTLLSGAWGRLQVWWPWRSRHWPQGTQGRVLGRQVGPAREGVQPQVGLRLHKPPQATVPREATSGV